MNYEKLTYRLLLSMVLIVCLNPNCSYSIKKKHKNQMLLSSGERRAQKKLCVPLDNTVRARRKTCLLRPDSGPCRADIISWYYDGKMRRCFRFFWGGCQGNGNRFDSEIECKEYCFLNASMPTMQIPNYCSLAFDYGHCYGQYNRWGWDNLSKTCKRRLYSGCGGNQNNFETKDECLQNCLTKPNNTMGSSYNQYTTCIPFTISGMQ